MSIGLDRDELLHNLIANKVTRGFQIEFVGISGISYFGFPIGLDQDMIQILTTPYGNERGNVSHSYEKYDLAGENYNIWLSIANIESTVENRLKIAHFKKDSQRIISATQTSFLKICQEYLDAKEEEKRQKRNT